MCAKTWPFMFHACKIKNKLLILQVQNNKTPLSYLIRHRHLILHLQQHWNNMNRIICSVCSIAATNNNKPPAMYERLLGIKQHFLKCHNIDHLTDDTLKACQKVTNLYHSNNSKEKFKTQYTEVCFWIETIDKLSEKNHKFLTIHTQSPFSKKKYCHP